MVMGEKLKIVDVLPSDQPGITVNFKGFVGDKKNNTGEDRGYEIDTARDLMKRYSLDKKGDSYPVIVSRDDQDIGKITVKLVPPALNFLVLKVNSHRHVLLRPEDSVSLSLRDKICMEEIQTNHSDKRGIHLSVNGYEVGIGESKELKEICTAKHNELDIRKGPVLFGKVYINVDK